MPTDEGVQVGWSDPNGIEDSKVRQVSARAESVHRVSAQAKQRRNLLDRKQTVAGRYGVQRRVMQH
jgi:hypothetical protein